MLLNFFEQVNVKRKEGRCGNTYGSDDLASGKIPAEVFRGSCNPSTVMTARTRLVAKKTEEAMMYERHLD